MQSAAREPALVAHLERYLGAIDKGFRFDLTGPQAVLDIAQFRGPVLGGAVAFATIGLSRVPFRTARTVRPIRHEFLWMHRPGRVVPDPPRILLSVARHCMQHGPLLRGQVVRLEADVVGGERLEAVYATQPGYFPSEFAVCELESGESCVIVWLVGVTAAEAEFAERQGWDPFETLLEQQNVDLLDLGRDSIAGVTWQSD